MKLANLLLISCFLDSCTMGILDSGVTPYIWFKKKKILYHVVESETCSKFNFLFNRKTPICEVIQEWKNGEGCDSPLTTQG